MKHLVRAALYRCIKDIFLYVGLFLCLGWGFYAGHQATRGGIAIGELNVLLCIIVATLSLCIGRKHADGAFRNFVIKGWAKGHIFLCEFLLGLIASSAMIFAFFGGCTVFGYRAVFSYFPHELAWKGALGVFLDLLFVCAVAISLSCLISRRVLAVLLNLTLVFTLWSAGEMIDTDLRQEKLRAPITLTQLEWGSDIGHTPEEIEAILSSAKAQGLGLDPEAFRTHESFTQKEIAAIKESAKAQGIDLEAGEAIVIPNPHYVNGVRRTLYEWLMRITPMGQLIRYDALIGPYFDPYNHWRLHIDDSEQALLDLSPFYTLGWILTVGVAGFFAFRRRELK